MKTRSSRLLYVEDEQSIAVVLLLYLQQQGYQVQHYANAADARRALQNLSFDLAILDVMLPGGDGRDLLQLAVQKQIPCIMVTARVSEEDRIEGFELGADDYVCKPYSPREVVSRVQALLKRSQQGHQRKQLHFEGLTLDLQSQLVWLDDQELKLTKSEYLLLHTLASQPDRVFDRQTLLAKVWPDDAAVSERTVDTHLTNLRKKLADSSQTPRFIQTRHGLGYQFIGRLSDENPH
jgi:two-component system alkaline phosphatase synthesis response regulator PhoP/two-component system response regulator BaeR